MHLPYSALAETNPFFDDNAAKTVFAPAVEVTVGGKIPDSFKSDLPKSAAVRPISEKREADGVTVAQPLENDKRAKLLEQFGDPTKDTALRTVDEAPLPFKGMMAALDAGDEGLAQQYAEQFQRYTEKLQRSNLTAVNLLGDAARQRELAAQQQLDDARLRAGLHGQNDSEKLKQSRPSVGVEWAAGLPVDPDGKVQVFLFFSSSDARSGAAAREVEALAAKARSDKRIQIVGVAADMMGSQAAIDFKNRYEISFPVIADTPLANAMGVRNLPSIAFVSPKTQQTVVKEGVLRSNELLKIVDFIQGRGASI